MLAGAGIVANPPHVNVTCYLIDRFFPSRRAMMSSAFQLDFIRWWSFALGRPADRLGLKQLHGEFAQYIGRDVRLAIKGWREAPGWFDHPRRPPTSRCERGEANTFPSTTRLGGYAVWEVTALARDAANASLEIERIPCPW